MNCEDCFISQWNREISTKIHKKKLEKIRSRECRTGNKSIQSFYTNRKNLQDRSNEISRENRILYNKLMNISERSIPVLHKGSVSVGKSLNKNHRKLEAERIIHENIILVGKLSVNNSEISFKKLAKEYEAAGKYREILSKKNLHNRIKKAVKKNKKITITTGCSPIDPIHTRMKATTVTNKAKKETDIFSIKEQ